jgi:hypothetical protein
MELSEALLANSHFIIATDFSIMIDKFNSLIKDKTPASTKEPFNSTPVKKADLSSPTEPI